jgi:hypothetical protein
MLVFILKFICVLATLFLLCFPFIPWKSDRIKWTVPNAGYSGKERWRNVFFVLEAVIYFVAVSVVSPYIKKSFLWFFGLGFMTRFVDWLPEGFVYTVDVLTILVVNVLLCFLFIAFKLLLKKLLDAKVFPNSGSFNQKKDPGSKKKIQKNSGAADRSESRLKRLRKKSKLVFKSKKNNKHVEPSKYINNKK